MPKERRDSPLEGKRPCRVKNSQGGKVDRGRKREGERGKVRKQQGRGELTVEINSPAKAGKKKESMKGKKKKKRRWEAKKQKKEGARRDQIRETFPGGLQLGRESPMYEERGFR